MKYEIGGQVRVKTQEMAPSGGRWREQGLTHYCCVPFFQHHLVVFSGTAAFLLMLISEERTKTRVNTKSDFDF